MQAFKQKALAVVAVLVVGGLLSACNLSGTNGKATDQVTLNGYVTDPGTGEARFNLSLLHQGQVATSGSVTAAGVTVHTAGFDGTARICGQIVSQDRVTAAIALDATGSTVLTDPQNARNSAAKGFVDRLTGSDLAAVGSFNSKTAPSPGLRALKVWQDLTPDKGLLKQAIDKATFSQGLTNLWDAVADSADLVAGQANPVALVFTDGIDNKSGLSHLDAANHAKDNGVKVYMLGLGFSLDTQRMQQVAAMTGGTFAATTDASELERLFDRLFNAIRGSFCVAVAFDPAPKPGTEVTGTLHVTVSGKTFAVPFQVGF